MITPVGDCGTVAAKFMTLHVNSYGNFGMEGLTDDFVYNFRKQYDVDIYRIFFFSSTGI